jgi:hypothetical protein
MPAITALSVNIRPNIEEWAGVSEHCVRRALKGETIARRNAEKIIAALDRRFQQQGAKGHIAMGSIKGLKIAELLRKPPPQAASEAADPL